MDEVGDGWNVVSGEALSSDEEFSVLKFWVLNHESIDEKVEVVGDIVDEVVVAPEDGVLHLHGGDAWSFLRGKNVLWAALGRL